MVRKITIALMVMVAGVALANRYVNIDKDGVVQNVAHVYGKNAKVDHDKNQYTDAEWDAFGITSELPYIVKDGAVWRDMTSAETNALNAQLQQDLTDVTTGDVQLDAVLRTIAEAISQNKKTYTEIVAIYKNEVDPKKVYKKEKDK